MLNVTLQRGQVPITFLMNEATANRIADDLESALDRRRSALEKFWRRMTGKRGHDKLTTLHGVLVTLVAHLPDGGIYLQTSNPEAGQALAQTLQKASEDQAGADRDLSGYADIGEGHQQANEAASTPPGANPVEETEAAPTLDDIANTRFGGRPSVSDVLIRSLESADELSGVAVVRVTKDGRVKDVYSNLDSLTLQGSLQQAAIIVIHGGQ
jgi:hypothetical protein